jgi:histidinol-phosphate/aromatic aminotransferase/cobyric acid decarboxylase-like protein/CTP:phosphocholine cytidylyltransferase-like protein
MILSPQPATELSGATELVDRPIVLPDIEVHVAEKRLVRRAVILAAGVGSRLSPLTIETPKCLTEVNGQPILFRALQALASQGLSEAVIIVGHHADQVRERVGRSRYGLDISYVEAPRYVTTNNIHSLWSARDFCDEDILLLEGDVVFDDSVLAQILEQPRSAAAVVPHRRELSGTVVRHDTNGAITDFVMSADQDETFTPEGTFKTVNMYLLRGEMMRTHFLPELCLAIDRGQVDDYYEIVLRDLVASGTLTDLAAVDVSSHRWSEVDNHHDLAAAEFQFLDRSAQFDHIQHLHGSYWRYGFVDHSYLYNLHFPTDEMLADFRYDLSEIVTNYPVGQHEIIRLLASWTGADPDHLVVANGGSELIKILGENFVERMTIPVPSFNEYENALAPGKLNRFPLDPETFELDVDKFGDSAVQSGSNVALIVTPNNPTSISVDRADLLRLARRLAPHGCKLIVDESFVEFSRVGPAASVESVLVEHPNLVVLKSMSKVLGIAGIRLGYLRSADSEFIEGFRQQVPIWNINGLAEAFLRQIGNYRDEFALSCELVRQTCQDFYQLLKSVPGLEPIAPDANFVFCKITTPGVTAADLAREIYVDHGILIKDCTAKSMPNADAFLRIASRTPADNGRLIAALADSRLAVR